MATIKTSHKLLLAFLGLVYLISPVDLIPEFLVPVLGWVDDGVVVYAIYHLIRYNRLPWNLFSKTEQTMTRFLTAADTRYEIRRYRYGRQNRPVLVFLHEGLGCVEMWKNFPERLAELTDCDAFVFPVQVW